MMGMHRSPEQKQEIEELIKQVEAKQRSPRKTDLLGTQWHLAYSTSQQSSGGKLGPFIGWVEQVLILCMTFQPCSSTNISDYRQALR